jgi:hypothetical protein
MTRLHLRYKNHHKAVLAATEELFASRPWTGSDDELQTKYERWIRKASDAYELPIPALSINYDCTSSYRLGTIVLGKFSVTSMFYVFRMHMQFCGLGNQEQDSQTRANDAQAWAYSLFYKVRPTLYRKAVRAGTIPGVTPEDLLRTDREDPSDLFDHYEDATFDDERDDEEYEARNQDELDTELDADWRSVDGSDEYEEMDGDDN